MTDLSLYMLIIVLPVFLLLAIQVNKDEYKAENIEKFRIIELNITKSCNNR